MQYKSKQKIDPKNEKSVHPLKSANAMNKKKNILNWTGKKCMKLRLAQADCI